MGLYFKQPQPMNPFFHQIITDRVKKYYGKHPEKKPKNFKLEKRTNDVEVEIEHQLVDFLYIIIGVLSAAFGLKSFLIPNSFIDGGVMGISLIASEVTGLSLPMLIVVLNLPFLILGYTAISPRFAIKSVIGIVLLSVAVWAIPFTSLTDEPILIAAFGGVFLGLGIGMAVRGGAIIDGTEVLAIFISRKTSLTVGNVILLFNILIFGAAAYFLTVETALYAILTYFAAAKMIDFVIDGIEEYIAVTIISDRSDQIRRSIIQVLGRGCTIFHGERGFSEGGRPLIKTQIVYTVITRLELSRLRTEIDKVDKKAFIVMTGVKDTKGGMIKKNAIKKLQAVS